MEYDGLILDIIYPKSITRKAYESNYLTILDKLYMWLLEDSIQ